MLRTDSVTKLLAINSEFIYFYEKLLGGVSLDIIVLKSFIVS